MTAEIINGQLIAKNLREQMTKTVKEMKSNGINPHLTVILVGDDPASHSYVRGKEKASAEVGISSHVIKLPANISEKELLTKISELNESSDVHGILVQLPLPKHINEQKVIETISPKKDVDGFHPVNVGKMILSQDTFLSCTPYGIMKLLEAIKVDLDGKHVVVIGRSNIVGKPMGQLLLNNNATVTYCHSRTKDIKAITNLADIVIVAVGKAHMVDQSYIKKDAIVIDVGVNRMENGKLTGDVDFESVKEKAAYVTPVPGGVGPMTITMLLANSIKAAQRLSARE